MIKKGETRHSLKTAGREKEMLLFLTQKHQVKAGKRADVGKKRETKALHNISSITSVTSEQSKTDHLKYFNKYSICNHGGEFKNVCVSAQKSRA
jgi:hypothetical protein